MKKTLYFKTTTEVEEYYPNGVPSNVIAIVGDGSNVFISSDNENLKNQKFFNADLTNDEIVAEQVADAEQQGYDTGHAAGYSEGETAGYNTGYSAGETAGYTAGETAGYNSGYSAGETAGYTAGEAAGYTAGEAAGYDTGYSAGETAGYDQGYAAGEAVDNYAKKYFTIEFTDVTDVTEYTNPDSGELVEYTPAFSIGLNYEDPAEDSTVYIRINGGEWQHLTDNYVAHPDIDDIIEIKATGICLGDMLNFEVADESWFYDAESDLWHTGYKYNIYGNIMSLLEGDDFTDATLDDNYIDQFSLMFEDIGVVDARNLILPENTTEGCYSEMFFGCEFLTHAPILGAQTLSENCYRDMFSGCSALEYVVILAEDDANSENYDILFGETGDIVDNIFKGNYEGYLVTLFDTYEALDPDATVMIYDPTTQSQYYSGDCEEFCLRLYGLTEAHTEGYDAAEAVKNCLKFTKIHSDDPEIDPSTITLVVEGTIDTTDTQFAHGQDKIDAIVYSQDGIYWNQMTPNTAITLENDNDFIYVKCDFGKFSRSAQVCIHFDIQGHIAASGDVTSLLNGIGGDVNLAQTGGPLCFYGLFKNSTGLISAPNLPSTTLINGCYEYMFKGCTALTTAPELPATTLANSCYSNMFEGCTALTTAPELPATTLVNGCYSSMFSGCSALTTAPELPATTLVDNCYSSMFSSCSALNSITCLAENISALKSTANWLNNVAATGTFTKVGSMTSWTTGVAGIPSGWTVENYGDYDNGYTAGETAGYQDGYAAGQASATPSFTDQQKFAISAGDMLNKGSLTDIYYGVLTPSFNLDTSIWSGLTQMTQSHYAVLYKWSGSTMTTLPFYSNYDEEVGATEITINVGTQDQLAIQDALIYATATLAVGDKICVGFYAIDEYSHVGQFSGISSTSSLYTVQTAGDYIIVIYTGGYDDETGDPLPPTTVISSNQYSASGVVLPMQPVQPQR